MKRRVILFGMMAWAILSLLISGCIQQPREQPTEGRKNIAECNKISDPCDRADCIGKIAVATNDMSLCNMFSPIKGEYCPYFECVDYVAEETKDAFLCEQISDKQLEEWCIGTVAGETKDAFLCEQISATNERDHCFKEVAEATKDTSLCNKIYYNYWKDKCVEVTS